MPWASLALTFLKLANGIIGLLDKEKMLSAGEARGTVKVIEEINRETEKARASIALIRTDPRWAQHLQELANRD